MPVIVVVLTSATASITTLLVLELTLTMYGPWFVLTNSGLRVYPDTLISVK